MALQDQWEKKILIVIKMLRKSENCFEVLQFIADKVDYFMQCLSKNHTNVLIMTEKLNYLLNLYVCVCENIKVTRSQSAVEVESSKQQSSEESGVSLLWREKWCEGSEKDKGDGWVSQIEENQIVILERLVVQTYASYPLLSMKAGSALQGAKQLSSKHGT